MSRGCRCFLPATRRGEHSPVRAPRFGAQRYGDRIAWLAPMSVGRRRLVQRTNPQTMNPARAAR
jgi:hypothetical protein